mgnify:CR=1 FL=1
MTAKPIIVQTTIPLDFDYPSFCSLLIKNKLAACIHISPISESFYCWDNAIESSTEHIIHIKTSTHLFDQVAHKIQSIHPYDTPEIITLEILDMSPDYRDWFNSQLLD